MFRECSNLVYLPDTMFSNITALASSETTSMAVMFRGCSKLKKIPTGILNQTKVTSGSELFSGCILLTNSDNHLNSFLLNNFSNNEKLTTLYRLFYGSGITGIPDGSFQNCPALTDISSTFYNCKGISVLPYDMFAGCTAITSAGDIFNGSSITAIPIGLMKDGTTNLCSGNTIFYNCTSMSGAIPEDFLMNVKMQTCYGIFYNCTKLTGTIPSNFLKSSSGLIKNLSVAFQNCVGITGFTNNIWNISDLSSITEFQVCFSGSGIIQIPSIFGALNFTNVVNANNMFGSCKSLVSIPDNFMPNAINVTNIAGMFNNCLSLLSVPVNFMTNSPKIILGNYVFGNCTKMVGTIDTNFLSASVLLNIVETMFYNCLLLNGIATGNIFERLTNGNSTNMKQLFSGCTNYTGVLPALWSLYPSNTNHSSCFGNCINASNYSSVPTGWK